MSTRTSSRRARLAMPTGDAYHHGALREALLAAGEALLAERGAAGFTLRECARRAGVSHAAPAHHFGDARGLQTALAARGFDRMADLMARYRDAAPATPEARLEAVGRAYIDFALDHRAHFLLMFGTDRLDREDAELLRCGGRSASALQQAMAEVMAVRSLSPQSLPQRMLLAWSAVHGFAMLVIDGHLQDFFGVAAGHPRQDRAAAGVVLALLQGALAGPG